MILRSNSCLTQVQKTMQVLFISCGFVCLFVWTLSQFTMKIMANMQNKEACFYLKGNFNLKVLMTNVAFKKNHYKTKKTNILGI